MSVHPLLFQPIYKRRIWGGQALRRLFGKDLPPDQPIGESWELADLPGDKSVVAQGPAAGRRIDELVSDWGHELIGRAGLFEGSFPLLIKFLDAQLDLSVQVHPDEDMARKLGGGVRVKHEAWYVLESRANGAIYKGLRPGVTRHDFKAAVEAGRCAELLNRLPVKPGDCHYLPSGTVHALGAGVVVAEIQTPSDVTYRVFDWNRIDAQTGRPRELHVDQALECIHFGVAQAGGQPRRHLASCWTTVSRLVACESFVIEKVRAVAGLEQKLAYGEPVVWIILSGRGRLSQPPVELDFKAGDTMLLPAGLDSAGVTIVDDTVWLEVSIPTTSESADFPRPTRAELQPATGTPRSPLQIKIHRS